MARFLACVLAFTWALGGGGLCIMVAASILPSVTDLGYAQSVGLMACAVGVLVSLVLALAALGYREGGARPRSG